MELIESTEEFQLELNEDPSKSLAKKSEKSGMSASILRQVYNRGLAAWKSGHRPGTTPEQWAHARVNSFITKSSGTWGKADKDLADKVRGSSKKESVEEGAVSAAQRAAIAISKNAGIVTEEQQKSSLYTCMTGKQFREEVGGIMKAKDKDGEEIDQITKAIRLIKNSPDSRRIIVSSWNVGELDSMALAPCHTLFQFYVADGKLSCQLYQRSADIFLGVPFNIASYALLTHMVAQQCDLEVGDFVWSGGDCHIYSNHFEQVNTQLNRTPKALPRLIIKRRANTIFDYKYEDFEFDNYIYDDPIKAPVAI